MPIFYFLCGRVFLSNTLNNKHNILSVTVLAIVLAIILYLSWSIPSLTLLNSSLLPLSLFTIRFLPDLIGTAIFAFLPSAFLYIGIISKTSH
jgi:hypothetical protein